MHDLAHVRMLTMTVLDEAVIRGVDPTVGIYLAGILRDVLTELAERRDRRRPTTRELCARIEKLEKQLADRAPGERAEAIRRRLGLPRSTYYRLRARVPVPSGTAARSNRGQAHSAQRAEDRTA